MVEIKSIKRLIKNSVQIRADQILPGHIKQIQERLNLGLDSSGLPLSYSTKRSDNKSRPLLNGARLFDKVSFDQSPGTNGLEFKASIVGEPARIIYYQNLKRDFIGFNEEDRNEIRKSILNLLRGTSWRF